MLYSLSDKASAPSDEEYPSRSSGTLTMLSSTDKMAHTPSMRSSWHHVPNETISGVYSADHNLHDSSMYPQQVMAPLLTYTPSKGGDTSPSHENRNFQPKTSPVLSNAAHSTYVQRRANVLMKSGGGRMVEASGLPRSGAANVFQGSKNGLASPRDVRTPEIPWVSSQQPMSAITTGVPLLGDTQMTFPVAGSVPVAMANGSSRVDPATLQLLDKLREENAELRARLEQKESYLAEYREHCIRLAEENEDLLHGESKRVEDVRSSCKVRVRELTEMVHYLRERLDEVRTGWKGSKRSLSRPSTDRDHVSQGSWRSGSWSPRNSVRQEDGYSDDLSPRQCLTDESWSRSELDGKRLSSKISKKLSRRRRSLEDMDLQASSTFEGIPTERSLSNSS